VINGEVTIKNGNITGISWGYINHHGYHGKLSVNADEWGNLTNNNGIIHRIINESSMKYPMVYPPPLSSNVASREKTLQKMWCGKASIQSGCWFQMRSTEFARSNGLTDDLSQVVLTFETT
jgi:hypothetical protein